MKNFSRIAIIGGGNLGKSIAEGLLLNSDFDPSTLTVTRRKHHLLDAFAERGVQTHGSNRRAVSESELVLLGVQPSQIRGVIAGIKEELDPARHVLVSLATGVTIKELREVAGNEVPVYRAMPNTAVALAESMTCLATDDGDADRSAAMVQFWDALGKAIVIEEALMPSATVLGACGIAYALRFIRAASQGGTEIGFEAELAQMIATQTVKGAAALLLEGGNHPEREIDKVTTPRGCTIAGLNEMEHQGFSSALIRGITTSHKKIEDIG